MFLVFPVEVKISKNVFRHSELVGEVTGKALLLATVPHVHLRLAAPAVSIILMGELSPATSSIRFRQ